MTRKGRHEQHCGGRNAKYVLLRVYVSIMGMQMQQPLPAFAPGSAHLGSKIPRMQEPYFRMNTKEVNEIEEIKKI